jgi:hypothetical protein
MKKESCLLNLWEINQMLHKVEIMKWRVVIEIFYWGK